MFKPTVYEKDESFDPFYNQVNKKFLVKSRVYPAVLISLGFFILLTQVVIPLVYFKTVDQISKPVDSTILGLASGFGDFSFSELQSNVSGVANSTIEGSNVPKYFYLTIPKLGIKDATVETDAPSLSPDLALGHYAGSSLPGEVGNTFIYGHSVLPWFYNPKNYKTIFSTLGDLNVGDTFTIKYNNRDLRYKVESKESVYPEKVNPLAELKPRYLNESTITLMTCTPPGTKYKRLLVNAVLEN